MQRYLDRITGKTASLFATAAEGGALVCDVPESDASTLYQYGLNLGIAFQIVDDVLDFSGDLYGKNVEVAFVEYLRPEEKFLVIDSLKIFIKSKCRSITCCMEDMG